MNTYSLEKLDLLYGCFNEYLFPEVKMNLKSFKGYFLSDLSTRTNPLVKSIIDIIEFNDFQDIHEGTFKTSLVAQGKSDQEIQLIVTKIVECKKLNKSQVKHYQQYVKDVCYQYEIDQARSKHQNNPEEFVKSISAVNYISNYSDKLSLKGFGEMNITDVYASFTEGSISSKFPLVNKSYATGKYANRQLIQVVGAPGAGKSMLLMNEAVHFATTQNKKVHYIALGDLNELDFVIRMSSILLEQSLTYSTLNIIPSFNAAVKIIKDMIQLTVVPADTVSPDEYVGYVIANIPDADVYMIDYDSNFQLEGDNMYREGGDTYDKVNKIVHTDKIVFIASQPKIGYWDWELLPKESAAESSRKQAIVDMMITIGNPQKTPNRMGKFNIPKCRRGIPGGNSPYIGTNDGGFFFASEVLYAQYKENSARIDFTSAKLLKEEAVLAAQLGAGGTPDLSALTIKPTAEEVADELKSNIQTLDTTVEAPVTDANDVITPGAVSSEGITPASEVHQVAPVVEQAPVVTEAPTAIITDTPSPPTT